MFILETIYACATSIIPLTDRSNPPWLKIHRYVSIPVQTSPPTLFHQFLIPSRRLNSPRILSWPEETAKPPKTPTTTPIHETVSIFPRTRTKPPPSFPCVDFRRVSRRGRRQTLKTVLTREDLSNSSCSQRTSSISSRPEGYRTAARQRERERERETVGGQYGREQNTEDARCLVFVVLLVAIQKKTRAPNARTFSNSFSFLLSRSTFPPTSAFAGLNATPNASNTGRNNRQHPKNAVVCNGWSSSRGSSSRVASTIGLIRLLLTTTTPGVMMIATMVVCFVSREKNPVSYQSAFVGGGRHTINAAKSELFFPIMFRFYPICVVTDCSAKRGDTHDFDAGRVVAGGAGGVHGLVVPVVVVVVLFSTTRRERRRRRKKRCCFQRSSCSR